MTVKTHRNLNRPAEILLVEDNENDAELTQLGIQRLSMPLNLHHVWNGGECMQFLRRQGDFAVVPVPDLILLDLHMPVMNGRDVLREISLDATLRRTPVVILTTSASEEEVDALYALRCSGYVVKPVDFEQFVHAIGIMIEYWFSVVIVPTSMRAAAKPQGNRH